MSLEKHTLLSICIPTRNQPAELAVTLNSLLPQLTPEVEIVVGDNSTDSRTRDLLQTQFAQIPLTYFSNEGDIGIDRNILKISRAARGQFIWWMGDDIPEPGSVKSVLNLLRAPERAEFIFVNFRFPDKTQEALQLGPSRFLQDRNEALTLLANSLGFASSIIFERRAIEYLSDGMIEPFIGSGFVNLYITLYVLAKSRHIFYMAEPLFVACPTKPGHASYDGFIVFGINYFKVVKSLSDLFSKRAVRATLGKNFTHVWKGVVVGYVHGYDSLKGRRWPMLNLYWSFPECWFALLLFSLPRPLLAFLYKHVNKYV